MAAGRLVGDSGFIAEAPLRPVGQAARPMLTMRVVAQTLTSLFISTLRAAGKLTGEWITEERS